MPTYDGNPWRIWVECSTETTCEIYGTECGLNRVWGGWAQQHTEATLNRVRLRQASARQMMIANNRARARRMREKFAGRKARQLLIEHLTKRQRAEYERSGVFHVETANGRRR